MQIQRLLLFRGAPAPPAIQLVHHFLETPSMICQKRNPSQRRATARADGIAEKVAAGWGNLVLTSSLLSLACLVPPVKVWFLSCSKLQEISLSQVQRDWPRAPLEQRQSIDFSSDPSLSNICSHRGSWRPSTAFPHVGERAMSSQITTQKLHLCLSVTLAHT